MNTCPPAYSYILSEKVLIQAEINTIDQKLFSSEFLSIHQIKIFKKRRAKLNKELKKLKSYK